MQAEKVTASAEVIKKYLVDLSEKEEFHLKDYDMIKLKKEMLLIYENVLSGVIKRRNIALVKKKKNRKDF